MNKFLPCLTFYLASCLAVPGVAIAAEEPQAEDYNLSMSGALINNWCEQNLQDSAYISIHACNYQMAQLYDLDVSLVHFIGCAQAAGGDIVKIADCMLERFNGWVEQEAL